MKKKMKILAAVPVLAGLAATPAIADDRLSLSGQMRVRAWMMDYDEGNDTSFIDHRLRIGGALNVAEGVSVHFRTDLTEQEWGSTGSTYGAGRYPSDSMQVDRGFLQLENDTMRLRAGLQYVAVSPSSVIDNQDEGLLLTFKNDAAPVQLFAFMDGDNEFQNEIADENWIFGFVVSPKFGPASVDFFGGYLMGTQDAEVDEDTGALLSAEQDQDIYIIGGAVSVEAGIARVFAEVNMFGGEINETTDATGLQGYVGADLKLSGAVTLTPTFWYAMAADADEEQMVVFGNNFDGWDPVFDVGTNLNNAKIGIGRPYDWSGEGAGVIGASLVSKYKVSDTLKLGAGINYLTVEDDTVIDDTLLGLVAGVSYALMDNASLDVQVEYHDHDIDGADAVMGGVYLGVNF